ncbi:IS3 family transposase [bacterium]|nr:IS3 family transposase [bacterium]
MIRREGWRVNHKRIERRYREEGLSFAPAPTTQTPELLLTMRIGPL